MLGRTDLELLKEKSREEVVEIATNNFIKELKRLADKFPEMKQVNIRHLNGIISMDIKVVKDGNVTTHSFTRDIYQFDRDDATSLHAKLKASLKPYKVKVGFESDYMEIRA